MEGLLVIVWILGIVWSILCIILFFKVWGMCNNVKRLTDRLCDDLPYNQKPYSGHEQVRDEFIKEEAPNNDIKTHDIITRVEDGAIMEVIEIKDGKYRCKDAFTHQELGEFSRDEIRKKNKNK